MPGHVAEDQLAIRAARHGVVISPGRSFHPAEPPGFLTGSAGHALALHALAAQKPPATTWDTALLLR